MFIARTSTVCDWLAVVPALLLAVAHAEAAAIEIGSETAQPFPDSAAYNAGINFKPGDGETVTQNPPRFSWQYLTNTAFNSIDNAPKEFQFQCAGSSNDLVNFTNLEVNIRTPWNFYNFLAPFTNATVFWRVGYINEALDETNAWSAVRHFTIAPGATAWDRSMLADTDYLASKAGHPHLWFSASNRAACSNWLYTNGGADWETIKTAASNYANSSWWDQEHPTNANSAEWAFSAAQVAFVWQLTGDTNLLDRRPQDVIDRVATWYITYQAYTVDIVSGNVSDPFCPGGVAGVGPGLFVGLSYGYDWLYDEFNSSQRSNVLKAIELTAMEMVNNYFWEGPSNIVGWGSLAKTATPHVWATFSCATMGALAAYNENASIQRLFDVCVNYMIGKVYPFGDYVNNQGREYGFTGFYDIQAPVDHLLLSVAFPEAQPWLNPWYNKNLEWWSFMNPVGYSQGNEPWGDTGWGRQGSLLGIKLPFRNIAQMTGNGAAYLHYLKQVEFFADPRANTFEDILVSYHFPAPATNLYTTNVLCLLDDGWVIGMPGAPNETAGSGFTNGLSLVLQARPAGNSGPCGHAVWSDGGFQVSAYGAAVTDTGCGYNGYGKSSYCQNTLLVNGLGTVQPQGDIYDSCVARIIAFTNDTDFLYVAADTTKAYPLSNFVVTGENATMVSTHHSGGPLVNLQKVQRHILMPRRKYFVMLDDLAMTNSESATFSWLYHVMESNLVSDSAVAFHYSSTNQYDASISVTTYVAHIANTNNLGLKILTGTNVSDNPVLDESYWSYISDRAERNRNYAIWATNRIASASFKFMTVIYPVKPGDGVPEISRINDYTVAVTNGIEGDVITFGTNYVGSYTYRVSLVEDQGEGPDLVFQTNTMRLQGHAILKGKRL